MSVATVTERERQVADRLYARRRIRNGIAVFMGCLTAAFGLFFLGWILWTLVSKAAGGINIPLFTQMTPPPMQEGGLLNAFFGSAVMCALAIAIGTPLGVAAGTWLSEYGRALGETMAVAFVIGNSVRLTPSLLEPSTTIAALIANDFGEATETYRSALLLLGFVLFIVTFVVLAIARLMLMQLARKEGK